MSKIKIHSFLFENEELVSEIQVLGIQNVSSITYHEENTTVTILESENTIQLVRKTSDMIIRFFFYEGSTLEGSLEMKNQVLPIFIQTVKLEKNEHGYDIYYALKIENQYHPYHWKLEIEG